MKCLNCGQAMQAQWKVCPHCGTKVTEADGPSVSVSDSVIKEVHQTHQVFHNNYFGPDVKSSRQPESAEYVYEQHVMTILRSGGSLERARLELEHLRAELTLTLIRTNALERRCRESMNGQSLIEIDVKPQSERSGEPLAPHVLATVVLTKIDERHLAEIVRTSEGITSFSRIPSFHDSRGGCYLSINKGTRIHHLWMIKRSREAKPEWEQAEMFHSSRW